MMLNKYLTAAVQMSSQTGDIKKNLGEMSKIVEALSEQHSELQLIVFPELVTTGFVLGPKAKSSADLYDGEHFRLMSLVAKKHKMHIVYGYVERDLDGHIYDSQILISDKGALLANYRKIHLTKIESDTYTAGSEIVCVDTNLGRIGMHICWDLAFQEMGHLQSNNGCHLLVTSSAWENPYGSELIKFAQARAIDNTLHIIVSNSTGKYAELTFAGNSVIYDPTGSSICEMDDQPGYIIAEVDLNYQKDCQNDFFSMQSEKRNDIYKQKITLF